MVEVTQSFLQCIPEAGYISIARVLFYEVPPSSTFAFDLQILFTTAQKGEICRIDEGLDICLTILNQDYYKFCPGIDLYTRECCRQDNSHARMVPKLREIHIIRDSWTKLNVTPAKIMQVSLQSILYVFLHQLGSFCRKNWCYQNCTNKLTVTLNLLMQLVSAAPLNILRLVIASLKWVF